MEFLNQSMLITGASQGIGLAVAEQLFAAGANRLCLTARDQPKLQANAGHLGLLKVCDHSDRAAIARLCEQLEQAQQQPSVVVTNVGVNPTSQFGIKKLHTTAYESLEQALQINVMNTFELLSRLLLFMKGQRFGRIVLVGSQAYLHGIPGQCGYNISKAALVGLKNSIVSEYGKAGVFCHLLNPGLVANERTAHTRKRHPNIPTVSEADVARGIVEALMINQPEQNGQEINL